MPITLFHGLALVFLHFTNRKKVDLLALTVSATFIDLEPLYYFLLGDVLDHKMWHGFAYVLSVYPMLVAFGVYVVERFFEEKLVFAYNTLRLGPERTRYPFLHIYLFSIVGGFSHIFFDMFTHENMPYVVYPFFYGNPFYLGQASIIVEMSVVLLVAFSCIWWIRQKRKFQL